MLNPGSAGPQVGERSTAGLAKAVKTIVLAKPKIPRATTPKIKVNFLTGYIIQGIIILLINKNFAIRL
jgi:hypothetical protein